MHRMTSAILSVLLAFWPVCALPQSTVNPAMNAPDETAWQLFIVATTSAGGSNATFETWASDTDTFRPNPQFPPGPTALSLHAPIVPSVGRQLLQQNGVLIPALPPGIAQGQSEETRRNRAAFDFIVKNNLYRMSGLIQAFGTTPSFPTDAIEVKANWIPVSNVPAFTLNRVALADVPKFFHVNSDAATHQRYALVSLHIISKLVPSWTWATFENRFNPGRCDTLGCSDAYGSTISHVPGKAVANKGYGDCPKTPALLALFAAANLDAVYNSYCLKGSQVEPVNGSGQATRLGNSITEAGFVDQSSCMTCHGRARWTAQGGSGQPPAGFNQDGTAPLGAPDVTLYWQSTNAPPIIEGMPGLTQLATPADFVWSIPFCAYDDSDPQNPKPSPCVVAGK